MRDESPRGRIVRRAAVLLELAASYLAFYFVRLPPGPYAMYQVWGVFRLVMGGVAFPAAGLFLVGRWAMHPRPRDWRIGDAAVFAGAVLLLLVIWTEMGYWVQETLVPVPEGVWAAWLRVSYFAGWVWWPALYLAAAIFLAVTLVRARAEWVHRSRARS